MQLRPAEIRDLSAIAAIQDATPEASQWRPEEYLQYSCTIAEEDRLLGFLVTRETAPGENEILNLAVSPVARRKGVATALLKAALARQGVWFLEVRESNQAARALYEGLGFSVAGVRLGYYQSPPEAGIVMRLSSC